MTETKSPSCKMFNFPFFCGFVQTLVFPTTTTTFVRKRGFFIGWSVDCLFPYYCIILNFLIWNRFPLLCGFVLTLVFPTTTFVWKRGFFIQWKGFGKWCWLPISLFCSNFKLSFKIDFLFFVVLFRHAIFSTFN